MGGALRSKGPVRPAGIRLICISLLALMGTLAAQSSRAVPLTVYGQLPNLEDVALSPDGTRIAYVRTQGDLRVVFVATVADHKMIRYVKTGEEKLRDLFWADDDNLLIETSETTSIDGIKNEWHFLRVYNVTRNELRTLPGAPIGRDGDVANTVVGNVAVRRIDGHTILFVPGIYNNQDGTALFHCDLTTGITSIVTTGSENASWIVDDKGRLVAEQDYDGYAHRWSIDVFKPGGSLQAASGHGVLDLPDLLGFGPTLDTVIVESVENGHRLWRLLSIEDGKFSAMPEKTVFQAAMWDPLTGRMIGGVDTVDWPQFEFLDPAWAARWQAIVKAFDGSEVSLVSNSDDFSKIVVLVQGAQYGYRYILIDLANNEAAPIGKVYEGIDNPLAVQRITYAAGDGLQIPAYLTLPNRPAHNLPLVVLPHGGPAERDTAEFDWWSQALADQGYAVLRPNYRGSTVTQQFLQAGFGQWGRKMQTDLSDGVRYLVKQGIADPAKVCIVGASYGGYAALAGVTLDPTVYRCGVSVAGISDLARLLEWSGRGGLDNSYATHYWDRFWGVSGTSDPALAAISPIKHVDAVKAPVLLIHGRDDTVVPYEQSQIMFDALHRSNKEVQLVTLKHEDHWLSHSETRTQMLEATVAFLRAHDPPN
jgi:dipeptidyl aminopeptidase/acylaminoacyl peptidase